MQGTAQTSVGGARLHVGRIQSLWVLPARSAIATARRQRPFGRWCPAAPRRGPGFQKQRHLRQSVANADGFDVGPRRQIALVGHQCQRLVARQAETARPGPPPRDGRMDAVGSRRPGGNGSTIKRWTRRSSNSPAFSTRARNACRLALFQGRRLPARPPSGPRLRAARQSNSSCGDRTPHRSPR